MRYQVIIPDGVSGDFKVVNEESYTKLYQRINSEWLVIMEDNEKEATAGILRAPPADPTNE